MSEDAKKKGPERVGSILDAVLESTGLRRRSDERVVLDDWAAIVGDKIAGHTRPVDIRDGVLYLQADDAAWRQELTLLIPEIKRKLKEGSLAFDGKSVADRLLQESILNELL